MYYGLEGKRVNEYKLDVQREAPFTRGIFPHVFIVIVTKYVTEPNMGRL